ncbi:MAG TPA: hypothetical protein VHA70_00855 [Bauldia sp.]|nr:hypothetical protein [Bauldia sp.]
MNLRVLLVLVGLVIGAVLGWATGPQPSRVDVGPLHIETQGGDSGNGGTATVTTGNNGISVNVQSNSPFDNRNSRTIIFAAIGAALGAVASYFVARSGRA